MDGSDSTIITIFIVSALIVLVLVVIIILFVLLYQRKILQQQMSLQNLEVTFQKELLAATLESQEVERRRIARDLHDSVGVMLSTLQLILRKYSSRDEEDNERREVVTKSSEIITSTISTVRRISHGLLPPGLELLGLKAALEHLVCEINDAGALLVTLNFFQEDRLPVRDEMLLFRIIQELLNNTLKHAEASEAIIMLTEEEGEILLIYSDNGRGMPGPLPGQSGHDEKGKGGLGLRNIESRARSLGGRLHWHSSSDGGMEISLRFKRSVIEESVA